MFITVSYDIRDDRRRNQVLNILKDYGTNVQYSVFECNLTQEQLNTLKKKIESIIKMDEDNVRFYLLCGACKDKVIVVGQGTITEDEEVYVV